MRNVLMNIVRLLKKLGYYVLQYLIIAFAWIAKVLKIQAQKWKKWRTRRALKKSFHALGAEVYSLYKQGKTGGLEEIPSADQQLQRVETTETNILGIDDRMDDIRRRFYEKKEQTRGKYTELRAAVDAVKQRQPEPRQPSESAGQGEEEGGPSEDKSQAV
jgi:hypothetical protein